MNQTHTSYKTSERLKEFLGESAPEPIIPAYYYESKKGFGISAIREYSGSPAAYQLHDLLSKPFLEAMCKAGACQTLEWVKELDANGIKHKCPTRVPIEDAGWMGKELYNAYFFDGGMEAVEKALTEMISKEDK